jgi:hypothetical protein
LTAVETRASRFVFRILILSMAVTAAGGMARAQVVADLPDAPQATTQSQTQPQSQTQTPPATTGTQQSSSSQQSSSQQTNPPKTKEEQQKEAAEQLKQEEKQRLMGVVPNFNSTDNPNALPLSPKQKFHLFFKSSVDPFVFVAAGLDAGEEQATNSFPGYGQGMEGYAKRFGASYADTFDGNLWGNAILPVWWHEDPRYFRKGTGTFRHRLIYALETNVWSKRDNGTWGPNYSNVIGNFISGGISNVYYPASDRGAALTVERAVTVTAEGGIGSVFVEFWPDVSKHVFHKNQAAPPAQAPDATKPAPPANGTVTPNTGTPQ